MTWRSIAIAKNKKDTSNKKTSSDKVNDLQKEREKNLMTWVSYWRENPHKCASDYFQFELYLFQKVLLYMMNKSNWFMYIATRGQGKSYIVALFCVIRCFLYPNTRIVIGSGTKNQAGLIITQKIMHLYNNYAAVKYEIEDISTSVNEPRCKFKNGSEIVALVANDNSRGYRGNIMILDEFRLIKKETVEQVFKPMLNVPRIPPFMAKPEYKDYPRERNKQIYISSAWFRSHWIWEEFNKFLEGLIRGKDYFVLSLPWQLSIHHKLAFIEDINEARSSSNFDELGFQMEYDALFPDSSDRSYFSLDSINECRVLNRTFKPPTTVEYLENKNKSRSNQRPLSNMTRVDFENEKRIIALDVALMGGNKNVKNDSSSFTCMRLIRDGDRYQRQVVYLESITESIETSSLAIRLKQLYKDFEADYVIVDTNGAGIGVFDALAGHLYDEERDEEYEPWISMNYESMNERIKIKGKPIIYSMKASASLNNDFAIQLKSALEKKTIELPINDIVKREELVSEGGFLKLTPQEKQRALSVYQAASALQSELVALEYEIQAGNIKIKEVGGATKDRYSSISYCNWYAGQLEIELRNDGETDWDDYFLMTGGREV